MKNEEKSLKKDEVFHKVLVKYKLTTPVPEKRQKEIMDTQNESIKNILKTTGQLTVFTAIAFSLHNLLWKIGIKFSIPLFITIFKIFLTASLISATSLSGYMVYDYMSERKVEEEKRVDPDPRPAPVKKEKQVKRVKPTKTTKPILAMRFDFIFSNENEKEKAVALKKNLFRYLQGQNKYKIRARKTNASYNIRADFFGKQLKMELYSKYGDLIFYKNYVLNDTSKNIETISKNFSTVVIKNIIMEHK